ncbi:MAG: CDP-archaeol synthase [Myxococcota bacterium]
MFNRFLAAFVGLAILIPALLIGGQTSVNVLCVLVLLIGADEYSRMAAPNDRGAWGVMLLSSFVAFLAFLWDPSWLVPGLTVMSMAAMTYGLFGVEDTDDGAKVGSRLTAGLLYLPLLLSYIPQIRSMEHGLAWIFMLLVATWLGDTGAYFAGRFLGRNKLFERVSPKKTWEGAVGGVIAGVIGAIIVQVNFNVPDLSWAHVVIIGALLPAVGVVGDLVESQLKRAFKVKDSGWALPGHGGILDRIDGLLFSAPILWAYLSLFQLG